MGRFVARPSAIRRPVDWPCLHGLRFDKLTVPSKVEGKARATVKIASLRSQ
jgi:hypothetical protein